MYFSSAIFYKNTWKAAVVILITEESPSGGVVVEPRGHQLGSWLAYQLSSAGHVRDVQILVKTRTCAKVRSVKAKGSDK